MCSKIDRLLRDGREWKAESQAGKLCGILGCPKKPTVHCSRCRNHYCEKHAKIHFHTNTIIRNNVT